MNDPEYMPHLKARIAGSERYHFLIEGQDGDPLSMAHIKARFECRGLKSHSSTWVHGVRKVFIAL